MAYVALLEFNTTYSVEVAARTQTGRGMVSPPVSIFVPQNSELLSTPTMHLLVSVSVSQERVGC